MTIKLLNSLQKLSKTISILQKRVDSFDYKELSNNISSLSNSDKLVKLEQFHQLKQDSLQQLQKTSELQFRETNEKNQKPT